MKTMLKSLRVLFAFVLAISMTLSLVPVAFAEGTTELHIHSLNDIPDSGEYDTIYIEASVGNEEVLLTGISCKKLVVLGGKSVRLAPGCTVYEVAIQHTGDTLALSVETGSVINNLVIESAEKEVTVSGKVDVIALKGENITASIKAGTVDAVSIIGNNSTLIVREDSVAASCQVEEAAIDSKLIIQGDVVSAKTLADNSSITVEKGGSVAVITTGSNTKGAEVSISGVVGHLVVSEASTDTKININSSGVVTAIGAEADVEINMDDGAKLENFVVTEDVTVSGNMDAGKAEIKDTPIMDGKVNLDPPAAKPANPQAPAEEPKSTEPAPVVPEEPAPEWAEAAVGNTYYADLRPALSVPGNVKMLTDQYYGNYQTLGYARKPSTVVTDDNKDNIRVDMWYSWGMEGMVDQNGNKCPQYLRIDDETKYRDTSVPEGEEGDWISAKEIYEYFSSKRPSTAVLVDVTADQVPVSHTNHTQATAEYSQAIDMNGCTIYKTDGNGNGLRLGHDAYDKATKGQTFYVENGSFVGETYTYDYTTDTWVDQGKSNTNNTLYFRSGSAYIVKNCDFTNGEVRLNFDGYNYKSDDPLTEVVFDNCSFDNTDINVKGGSYNWQKDGYQFDMNFTDCSFIIEKDGQIVLNYYVWGDVNFSNCDFTVSDSTLNSSWNKAIKIDAYSGSNGNHDLTVTIEGSTLNDSPITGDNARQLVYNSNEGRSNDVTTVFVDPDEIGEGEETVTLMDHSANETVDQDTIAPESAAENALEIETRAEEILEVEIVNAEPAPVCAADSAATVTTGDVSAESDIGDAE